MLTFLAGWFLKPRYQQIVAEEQDLKAATEEHFKRLSRSEPALGTSLESLRGREPFAVSASRYARTSTGKPVPWTPAHSRFFAEFQKDVAAVLVVGRGLTQVVEKPALIAQAGWELSELSYSSAIAAEEAAPWVRWRMRPSLEALRAPTVQKRVEATKQALIAGQPLALSGIPSYALAMLKVLSEDPDAKATLLKIQAYLWSGMRLGPGLPLLQKLLSPSLLLSDVASSTEGPLGLPAEAVGLYRLARQSIALFIPDQGGACFAWEVEPGLEYRVRLVSAAGIWESGDRVRIEQIRPLRFSYMLPELPCDDPWFRLFLGEKPELLIEPSGEASLNTALLPSGCHIRQLVPGSLSKAILQLGLQGYPKLPWSYKNPKLHQALLSALKMG
jgi:hypothetical protein